LNQAFGWGVVFGLAVALFIKAVWDIVRIARKQAEGRRIEEAVLNAYGLLEGASTYGEKQAIRAALETLGPIVDRGALK